MTSTEDLIAGLYYGFAMNYYAIALAALTLYEYLLTFPDEVKYAWKGKRTWVFFLFLAIRYIPMLYRVWVVVQGTWPGYTQELCSRTIFIHVLFNTLDMWLAQVALAARVYAMTSKNIPITACLASISICRLGFGIYHSFLAITYPGTSIPEIPGLRIPSCWISRHRVVEVTTTVLVLPFDIIIFVVTIYFAMKQGTIWSRTSKPNLFGTLARDGALYFMVIFTSHIIHTFVLILGRPEIQIIPIGVHAYIPIMICRLMLSIRKAALTSEGWESYTRPSVLMSSEKTPGSTVQFAPDTANLELDCLSR